MTKQEMTAMLHDENLWQPRKHEPLKGVTVKAGSGCSGMGWRDAYNAGK